MDSKSVFPDPLKIRYKGYFDWPGVYKFVWKWLLDRQFRVHEKRYKDKVENAFGNELEVDVWGEKEVTEYYKYRVDIAYHLWESKEVPVTINGKQTKTWLGRIEIKIRGTVFTDWQKRYDRDNNKTHKFMEDFLNKVVLKYEIEMRHVDPLDKDLHALEGKIKKIFKMETDPISV